MDKLTTLYLLLAFVVLATMYALYVLIDILTDILTDEDAYINTTTGEVCFSIMNCIVATVSNLIHFHFFSIRWIPYDTDEIGRKDNIYYESICGIDKN